MQLVISVHNTKKNNSLIFLLLLVLPLFKIFVIFYQFLDLSVPRMHANFCLVIAKFHYTDPTRTRTDPTEFRRKKVRAGPCGSGRVRVGSV